MRAPFRSQLPLVVLMSAIFTLAFSACDSAAGPEGTDAGAPDSGSGPGADAGGVDAGSPDAGSPDAGNPDDGGTFTTPDLLDNASFETGWDGFKNNSGGSPSIVRTQERAHAGTWSAKSTFVATPGSEQAQAFTSAFAPRDEVYARVWFNATALPDDQHKWIRFQTPGFSGVIGGLYTDRNGRVVWAFPENQNINVDLGIGVPTLDVWHSIEVHFRRFGDTSASVRVWYDGQPTKGTAPGGTAYWAGTDGYTLYAGAPQGGTSKPSMLVFDDTINQNNTRAGAIYYDRIALSSARIGP